MKIRIKRLMMGTISVIVALLLSVPIYARAAESVPGSTGYFNFFKYQIMNEGKENEEACILSYMGKDTELTIPSEVKGIPVTTINANAFRGRGTVTKVTIPEGVKTIGSGAFATCVALTEVNIPSTVETIGKSAFETCQKLVNVNINTENCKLETIGERAFYSDLSIVNFSFPELLKEIGGSAFEACSGIEEIALPKNLENIGNKAFMACSGLKKATIAEGTKTIGENAFGECSELTEVYIPSTMEDIQESAFETCEKLVTVKINTENCKLKKIGPYAFHDCGSIVNFDFPASLKEIGENAFLKCEGLEKIELPHGLEKIGNSVFAYCKNVTEVSVPLDVKSLGELMFNQCNNIKKATIPAALFDRNTLTSTELESIILLDDGTTTISDKHVLTRKVKLTDIVFSDSITEIPSDLFGTCEAVKNVKLPVNLKKIGDYAFSNCKEITTIDIPKGVITIGEGAFANCPLLSSVNIPDTVQNVGDGVFAGSPNLHIDISKKYFNTVVSGIENKRYTGEPVTQDKIVVKSNGTTLEKDKDYTVSYDNNVDCGKATLCITGNGQYTGSIKKQFTISDKDIPEVIDISDSSSEIRIDGFAGTQKYTGKAVTQTKMTLYRQDNLMSKGKDYKVIYSSNVNAGRAKMVISGIGAYKGTITKYFRIVIPNGSSYTVNGIKYKITKSATDGSGTVAIVGSTKKKTDRKFTSLTVNSAVRIGGVRFKVTRIKAKSLSGYSYLKSVYIGDGVKVIEPNAFYGCKSLRTITIGKGITTIGDKAFCRCTKLSKVVVKSKGIKKFGRYTFTNSGTKPGVYVPKTKLDAYKKLIKKSGMTSKAVYKVLK